MLSPGLARKSFIPSQDDWRGPAELGTTIIQSLAEDSASETETGTLSDSGAISNIFWTGFEHVGPVKPVGRDGSR